MVKAMAEDEDNDCRSPQWLLPAANGSDGVAGARAVPATPPTRTARSTSRPLPTKADLKLSGR